MTLRRPSGLISSFDPLLLAGVAEVAPIFLSVGVISVVVVPSVAFDPSY